MKYLFVLLFLFFPFSFVHAAQCSYGSTQARVQNNINIPWQSSIQVGCEKSFRVGGFHNHTGQFANDVSLHVTGPGFNRYFFNGDTVTVNQTGNYTLTVRTNNQEGAACSEQAKIAVSCQAPSPQCLYQSTQSRVQANITQPWSKNLSLSCNQSFRVGGFHNDTGQFANDTTILVTDPFGFSKSGVQNGQTVHAFFPGRYIVTVATSGQSGAQCGELSFVDVQCATATIPAFWRTILQQHMID